MQLTHRQLVVRLVNKAISTGISTPQQFHKDYLAGRSAAFVQSAAYALNALYGCDADKSQHFLNLLVRDVRKSWPLDRIVDGRLVQLEAEAIVDGVMDMVS